MKKSITVAIFLAIVFILIGCGKDDRSNVKIDYGNSSLYANEEMDSAIDVIKNKFSTFEGCELHCLSYMSDKECNTKENIKWINDLRPEDNEEVFTQCIAFNSSFRSPKKGGGTWQANEEYTWQWWLARSECGEWKLMTFGY